MRYLIICTILWLFGCEVEQPAVSDKTYKEMKFIHAALTVQECSGCHEKDRPKPDAEGNLHGDGGDCGSCHETSDTKEGWTPPKAFSHQPPPKSCVGCHASDRPGLPHPPDGDCVTCHQYPSWK